MGSNTENVVEQLHGYATEYRLAEFEKLFSGHFSGGAPPQAHMLRAQLGLMVADETVAEDLKAAGSYDGEPELPCLFTCWQPQDPNYFVVFNGAENSLKRFCYSLADEGEVMRRWYGDTGYGMVRQILSEILYYTGRSDRGFALAEEQYIRTRQSCVQHIMAGYALFRCSMAEGRIAEAQEALVEIIETVRNNENHPTCTRVYQTVRDWVNLTTGWSGDMPRYHRTPDNTVLPVLEDRTVAIHKGIDELGPTEKPFVEYAALRYSEPHTMRGLFMDVFHAIYWFRAGDYARSEASFERAYRAARPNELIMPFAEYGMQITPMLRHICGTSESFEREWIENIISVAEGYEDSLRIFRRLGEEPGI